jgi:ParB/RepB/Spo0J family partition protein
MARSAAAVAEAPRARTPDEYRSISLDFIQENTWNPRKHYDAGTLEELTASIREKGLLEPMIVRPIDDGLFEIVAGSRRLRAARGAGLTSASCVVKALTDAEALEVALSENLQRQDMHPLDEAEAYATLQRTDKRIYTNAAIARRTGQTESHVYRRLKLLELDDTLRTALAEDRLSIGHAERLLRLPLKLRQQAAHPENGVVWRRSPLLEYGDEWIPQREDLRPLNELEKFIRTKSAFDPTSEDTRHFQPELAAAIEEPVAPVVGDDTEADVQRAIDEATSTMVLLSDDPMARMRLGAGKTDHIPLTPSKWREVKNPAARCEYTVRGVITHGGPARVLDVCTKKSCPKHWPVAKKQARAGKTETFTRDAYWKRQEEENRKANIEQEAWEHLLKVALPAFGKHVAGIKFSAALVMGAHHPPTATDESQAPEIDDRMVPVYRLDWLRDDDPENDHSEPVQLDVAYYAHRDGDQIGAKAREWLAQLPGTYVMVSTDEIPLGEWIGDYGGDPEDAEP